MHKYLLVIVALLLCIGWNAPAFSADYEWAPCNVGKVRVKEKTLGVYCAAPYTGDQQVWNKDVPNYAIAFDGTSEMRINALLQLLVAAKVNKRPVNIRYSISAKQNPPGCASSNCRRMEAVTLR